MKRPLQIYFLLFCASLLFSCSMEKRQFRSGYYISWPRAAKNDPGKRSGPAPSNAPVPAEENATYYASEEKEMIPAAGTAASLPGLPVKEISPDQKFTKKDSGIKEAHKGPPEKNKPARHALPEDEEIKKDVKMLFVGSIITFLLTLLYGLVLSLGMTGLSQLIFVLVPFAIIGLWIYSLLLHNKYGYEDTLGSQKKKKEKLYSQRRAFLLAGFLGIFGVHRFYLGYTQMAIFEMLTLGGFFVLYFIDMIRIKQGKLKPQNGEYEKENSTYTRAHKQKAKNKSVRFIKIALLISLLALLSFLGFSIFFL